MIMMVLFATIPPLLLDCCKFFKQKTSWNVLFLWLLFVLSFIMTCSTPCSAFVGKHNHSTGTVTGTGTGTAVVGRGGGGTAFLFASTKRRRGTVALQESKKDLIELSKKLNPAIGFWDPLGLADSALLGNEERTIGWLRHSEIKHGRIAMFAFVGYLAQHEIRFPWAMTLDGSPFPILELTPPEQWDYLPIAAKLQIIAFIGFLEIYSELTPGPGSENVGLPHYTTKEGIPGKYPSFTIANNDKKNGGLPHNIPWDLYDPLKIYRIMPKSKRERGLLVEINNGRLAMIGIMGFMCEHAIPGSVPLLNGIIKPYDGQIMAPFEKNLIIDYDAIFSAWGISF